MAIVCPKPEAVTVRLTIEQAAQIDRIAEREREPRSVIIRRMLNRGLSDERRSGGEAA